MASYSVVPSSLVTVVVWAASVHRRIARTRVSGSSALDRDRETIESMRASSTPSPEVRHAAATHAWASEDAVDIASSWRWFADGGAAFGTGAGEGGSWVRGGSARR